MSKKRGSSESFSLSKGFFLRVLRRIRQLFLTSVSKAVKKGNAFNAVMLREDQMHLCPLELRKIKILGSGTYGVVKLVQDVPSGNYYAMKTNIFNPYVNNREIELLSCLKHPNVINLAGFFFWDSQSNSGIIYQNMLFEPFPFDLYYLIMDCRKRRQRLCDLNIKIYSFQMFRGLAYLHAKHITHRDIKPANLLVDTERLLLKITDFGCAKENITKTANTPYMCSRYYRAPELILENAIHDESIDVWSAACVVAECFLGEPIFPGRRGRQMAVISRILGTPTEKELKRLNPKLTKYDLKYREPQDLTTVLGLPEDHMAVHLLQKCFQYDPSLRPTAWQACSHDFFDEILERPDIKKHDFSVFETDSMPREIRAFLATKPRCTLKRSVPWKPRPSSQQKFQNNRIRTTLMMDKIRSLSRKKLELAKELPADNENERFKEKLVAKGKGLTGHKSSDTTFGVATPKLFELTHLNKEVKYDILGHEQRDQSKNGAQNKNEVP